MMYSVQGKLFYDFTEACNWRNMFNPRAEVDEVPARRTA